MTSDELHHPETPPHGIQRQWGAELQSWQRLLGCRATEWSQGAAVCSTSHPACCCQSRYPRDKLALVSSWDLPSPSLTADAACPVQVLACSCWYTSSASSGSLALMHTFISALKVCTLQGMPRVRISATSSSAFRSCWWDPHWLITAGQGCECHEKLQNSVRRVSPALMPPWIRPPMIPACSCWWLAAPCLAIEPEQTRCRQRPLRSCFQPRQALCLLPACCATLAAGNAKGSDARRPWACCRARLSSCRCTQLQPVLSPG